jgi:chemotaxis protein CheY-P-specific phosphatase CheC
MSSDKAKKKVDKILELTQERVSDEVGGLMGATMSMSGFSTRLISKEDFFDEPSGKVIFSEMSLTGELEGDGGIIVSVKDAVRLGGTLIMLPDSELEECVTAEDYSEEIEDSYGEIANIIAGAYTKTFEEMYSKNFRFVRKNQEILSPMKVDVESDKPIPNQNYYEVSTSMELNDVQMGKLILLIPAAPLGLDDVAPATEDDETGAQDTLVESDRDTTEPDGDSESGETSAESSSDAPKPVDIKKQKKRVDACLKECSVRMGDEIGAMLGAEVTFTDHETRMVNKEDYFFDEASGKQILAHMDVVGEREGKSYLFVGLKDAIFIGGTLIMLPSTELEKCVGEEEFTDDTEDAYGEIANIISGVYTKVFEEQYIDKIRFIKTSLEQVVPMKVDAESDEPMPDVPFYMATSRLNIGDKPFGNLQFLVPADLFKLEGLGEEAVADDAPTEGKDKIGAASTEVDGAGSGNAKANVGANGGSVEGSGRAGVKNVGEGVQNPEIILVSNDGGACSTITAVLNDKGVVYRVLDYKENISDYLPGDVKAIFLIMPTVDEQGLGVAIKINAACSLPLIAVGPEWTRTKVIKAVKYGVDDILISPASDGDIAEKIDSVQAKIAA